MIPFRESKLTRLFQGFFCGKGRASMIVNVNMCASMFDETFHVMKFSAIAKKVRNSWLYIIYWLLRLHLSPDTLSENLIIHYNLPFFCVSGNHQGIEASGFTSTKEGARVGSDTPLQTSKALRAVGQWSACHASPSRWRSNSGGGRRGGRKRSHHGGAWCLSAGVRKTCARPYLWRGMVAFFWLVEYPAVFNIPYFSVLIATYGPGQGSPRKIDWRETQDADIRIEDTRRSVSRDGRTAGLHWESVRVRPSHMNHIYVTYREQRCVPYV